MSFSIVEFERLKSHEEFMDKVFVRWESHCFGDSQLQRRQAPPSQHSLCLSRMERRQRRSFDMFSVLNKQIVRYEDEENPQVSGRAEYIHAAHVDLSQSETSIVSRLFWTCHVADIKTFLNERFRHI